MLSIQKISVMLLLQVRGEMKVMPAVTTVMLQHIAKVTGSDWKVVSTG